MNNIVGITFTVLTAEKKLLEIQKRHQKVTKCNQLYK